MKHLLAIDTATSRTTAALSGGSQLSVTSGQRHGALLHELLEELLGGGGAPPLRDLSAVVVGTGPGNFTGLRIGMATAKTIAYARQMPIVGVPTACALAQAALQASLESMYERVAAGAPIGVIQPAGPSDRYVTLVRFEPESGDAALHGQPRVLGPGESIDDALGEAIPVAVDLTEDTRVPADAVERGQAGLERLGEALLTLGDLRLRAGRVDDVAELVPTYVTLPRGVQEAAQEIAWSPARA